MTLKKKIALIFIAAAVTATGIFAACNKPDKANNAYIPPISDVDLANVISAGVSFNSNGFAEEITAISNYSVAKGLYTTTPSLQCGIAFDTSFTRSSNSTAGSYMYGDDLNFTLSCIAGAPDSLNVTQEMHGSYALSQISGTDGSTAQLVVKQLQPAYSSIIINGTYIRTGTDSSKIGTKPTFSSVITYTLSNITLDKTTQKITGGVATVGITGFSNTGVAYQNSGLLTFDKNGVTLTLDGNDFTTALY